MPDSSRECPPFYLPSKTDAPFWRKPKNTTEKWEKIINKFKGNIVNNVNNIQKKVDAIDREVINKEKKLKFEGGMGYNPELGQEISNLLLDSIGAKLSLLNKLAKM